MTPLAILFMVIAIVSVSALTTWCYVRVLSGTSYTADNKDQE